MPKVSRVEIIIENFDDEKEHYFNQHDNVSNNLNKACKSTSYESSLCELISNDNVASMSNSSIVNVELLISFSKFAFCVTRDEFDIPSSFLSRLMFQSMSLFVTFFVFETANLKMTSRNNHIITHKIFNDNQIFRVVVYVKIDNRINILNQARKYCMQRAQNDQNLKTILTKNVILPYIH